MPLSDEALIGYALIDHAPAQSAPADSDVVPARDVPCLSITRVVAAAATAFLVVFLISMFIAAILRGDGWGSAIASALTLGTAGAGLQLMLCAVRRRRAFEGASEV